MSARSKLEDSDLEEDEELSRLPGGKTTAFIAALLLAECDALPYLPAAFMQTGVVLATIVCGLAATALYYTSGLLVEIAYKLKKWSYDEICCEVLGSWGHYTLAGSCIIFNYGACVCYLLSIQEMMTVVLAREWGLQGREWFEVPGMIALLTIVVTTPIILPLSLMRDLSALRFAAFVKIFVQVGTVISVIVLGSSEAVKSYQQFATWKYPAERGSSESQLGVFLETLVEGRPKPVRGWDADSLNSWQDAGSWEEVATAFYEDLDAQDRSPAEALVDRATLEDPVVAGTRPSNKMYLKLAQINKTAADTFAKLLMRNHPDTGRSQKSVGKRFGEATPYLFNSGGLAKLGTLVFSFVFHDTIFPVMKTLKKPNAAGWRTTALISLGILFVTCSIFGVAVGMMFGWEVPTNVLTSNAEALPVFPIGDLAASIVQIAFSIVILLTYPECMVMCREYLEAIVVKKSGKECSRGVGVVLSMILVAATIPWLFAPHAGEIAEDILDIVGALTCGIISFVLPVVLHQRVFNRLTPTAIAVLIFGFLLVIVCPTLKILEIANVKGWLLTGMRTPGESWE